MRMDAGNIGIMAETFITQCPHCGTSFRVKDDQLAVANGSVRCGACLQVFGARNHVVTGKPAPKATASNSAAAARKPAPSVATPTEAKLKAGVSPVSNVQRNSAFEADRDDDADFIFADDPDEDDEFIFQDSDDDLHERRDHDNELGEFSDSFLSLNASDPDEPKPDPFKRETESLNPELFDDPDVQDESWAESILSELEEEEKRAKTSTTTDTPRKPARREPEGVQKAQTRRKASSLEGFEEQADFEFEHAGANQASQLVRQLNHEIDLDFTGEERLARWRWLGGVFALLLLVTLAGQLAWLQKDTYAKMDQWRGLYASACEVLGCTLPAQEDLSQIRASNVLVRDHKVLDEVKMLDAVLINRAPFKQSFPTLIIQYTDVNGALVADQAFSPEEYLRGELTGANLMPMNTRVYVSIPIRDPGQRAVNYQLMLAQS